MPQIDELSLDKDVLSTGITSEVLKGIVNKIFWTLFERNKDVTVFTFHKKVIFIPISITVHLADIKPLFESIFGPEVVDETPVLGV